MKKNITWAIVIAVHIILIISIFVATNDDDPKKSTTDPSDFSDLDGGGLDSDIPPVIEEDGAFREDDPTGTVGQNPDLNHSIYIVKKGDMGGAIARKYDISWANIKEANNLTSDSLRVGQELKIPKL